MARAALPALHVTIHGLRRKATGNNLLRCAADQSPQERIIDHTTDRMREHDSTDAAGEERGIVSCVPAIGPTRGSCPPPPSRLGRVCHGTRNLPKLPKLLRAGEWIRTLDANLGKVDKLARGSTARERQCNARDPMLRFT